VVIELAANAVEAAIHSARIVDGEDEQILFSGMGQVGDGDVSALIFDGKPVWNWQEIFWHVNDSRVKAAARTSRRKETEGRLSCAW
jgi:hypothetical protein